MSAVSVGDVRRVLDEAYPPHLAEKWDAVGLICGDPAAEVKRVAFAAPRRWPSARWSSARTCSWSTTRCCCAGWSP